jgi:hypothetical protein
MDYFLLKLEERIAPILYSEGIREAVKMMFFAILAGGTS